MVVDGGGTLEMIAITVIKLARYVYGVQDFFSETEII